MTPRAPAARPADGRPADARASRRPTVPRSFQTRLTFAFIGVVALTLALVAPIVVNRIDDYFRQQEEQSLQVRAKATAAVIDQFIETTLPGHRIVAEFKRPGRAQSGRRGHPGHARPAADRGQQRGPGGRDPRVRAREARHRRHDDDRSRPGSLLQHPPRHRAEPGPGPGPTGRRGHLRIHDGPGRSAMGHGRHPLQPVHEPGEHPGRDHRPAAGDGGRRVPGGRPRRRVPRPPLHDPADAPHRGVAPAGGGRPLVARDDGRGVVEHDRAAGPVAAVQHDGRPARAERRDHPPRPRLQPRLPGRRQPRAADADRRDAHVHRAPPGAGGARPRRPDRVPRLLRRPARPARLARPEPARALEARLRARAAGPATRRRAGHHRVRRRAAASRRRSARASS